MERKAGKIINKKSKAKMNKMEEGKESNSKSFHTNIFNFTLTQMKNR